jgi:hypothetical protein
MDVMVDKMRRGGGAVCVAEDLLSCPLVKGRSGAEVARREGRSHGRRFVPVDLLSLIICSMIVVAG